jgi:hypothetical protein
MKLFIKNNNLFIFHKLLFHISYFFNQSMDLQTYIDFDLKLIFQN